jgi:heme a synthase
MSDSTFTPNNQSLTASLPVNSAHKIYQLVWKIAIATWLLMAVGSATRVMNAGLACPDWPLCYGQAVPLQQMNLQVFLEWFHRLDAGLILLSTVALYGRSWWSRKSLPAWLPVMSTVALLLILAQAALGAFTVTELLRFDIVTAHLGTALLFFSALLAIGSSLSLVTGSSTKWLTASAGISALLIYGQSLLGALVGSQWALHQCFGSDRLCGVMNSHLWGVIPATLSVLVFLLLVWRTAGVSKILRQLGGGVALLTVLQIALGMATFRLHLQAATLTVAHQSIGALLLGTLVVFTTLSCRMTVGSVDDSRSPGTSLAEGEPEHKAKSLVSSPAVSRS